MHQHINDMNPLKLYFQKNCNNNILKCQKRKIFRMNSFFLDFFIDKKNKQILRPTLVGI
jgi:hypothetical protein